VSDCLGLGVFVALILIFPFCARKCLQPFSKMIANIGIQVLKRRFGDFGAS
jgi:hypothetical protein